MNVSEELSFILNPVLKKMLVQYQNFLEQPVSLEAKNFTAYHNACKSVLGHISILLKLLQNDPNASKDEPDLLALIERAKTQTMGLLEENDAEFD